MGLKFPADEPSNHGKPRDTESHGKNVLKVVVTDGISETAHSLLYRIFYDDVFGKDQPIFLSLHESKDRAMFLESVAIEVTSFGPNLLEGISYTHDPSIAFKDADVVFAIGKARGYEFKEDEYSDAFFKECVSLAKLHGEAIEAYAKKEARVIVLGSTAAAVISRCAKSIPPERVTALNLFNLRMTEAHIAAKFNCLPNEVKNVIVWGSSDSRVFPDCKHLTFSKEKIRMTDELRTWIRNDLPRTVQKISNRSWYTRSLAYGLAEHCKLLWNGTPEGEWTNMCVMSDASYGVHSGIFFSYPVVCRSGDYEIVQGLVDDEFTKRRVKTLSNEILGETRQALEVCGLSIDRKKK